MASDTSQSNPLKIDQISKSGTFDNGQSSSATRALHPFAENLWTVEGPEVRDMGIMFTTRMVVAKLRNGFVWVSSPVPTTFSALEEITNIGPVGYLISGTPRHVWRLETWHSLFPRAELWVCKPTPFTLKKAALPVTGILGDAPESAWGDDFNQLAFQGSASIEEIVFYHKASHTVILDDLVQSHHLHEGQPFLNALLKLSGAEYPLGGVGIDMRLTFTHRELARRSLAKLLSWDFDKLIIAHGPCIEKDAKPFLERAFRWLIH